MFFIRSVGTGAVLSIHSSLAEAKKEIIRLQTIQHQNKLKIISYEILNTRTNKVVYESDKYHY